LKQINEENISYHQVDLGVSADLAIWNMHLSTAYWAKRLANRTNVTKN